MDRPWAILMGILVLGVGCGIPESIYVEDTPPEIYSYWPPQSSIDMIQGSEGQMFTICAEDADGDLIDYSWKINGEEKQGNVEGAMCDRTLGTTYSLAAVSFTLGTRVYVSGVARDTHNLTTSHTWIIGIAP